MENLEKCLNKKEVSKLLNALSLSRRIESKVLTLRHLKNSPLYRCYFCDGYNYNCESYELKGGER